jgi:2-succinyl-5-enolpyruvyl-6-hydroxy-3-cyclohexene-1-carboxylate synthase
LALLNLRYSAESVGSISNGEAPTAWRPSVEAAQERLVQRLQSTEAAHGDACLAADCLTDGVAVSLLLDHLPAGMRLSVGNSAAIRHALRSASIRPQSWDRVWQGNRGTSGIDGSSSTALGAAWSDGMPTCLLTGELSFFYDATAWFQESLPPAFVAVVLNNAGGGIFRLIDGPSSTGHLARDFEVRHQRSVLPWAREMGCTVFSVKTAADWLNILRSDAFLHPKAPCVIEVCTDPDLTENQWKNPIL